MRTDSRSISSSGSKDYFKTEHLKTGLKKRALKGASLTVIAQVCNYAILSIGTIILARLLSPHDFGLVTMVLSVSLLLGNLGANGFIDAIVQKEEIHHKQISTLFWINVGINLSLTVAFIALAPVIVWFYNEPLLTPIVVAMSVTIVFAGLSNQHQALLRRNMEFHKTVSIDIIATIISLLISIYLAFHGWGYWALVAKWIISPFVVTIGAWIMCGWRPGLPSRGTGIMPMLYFAFSTYGTYSVSYFRRNIDKIFIGRFLGSQSLGNYDRAYQLANMLPNQLMSPLNSVAISAFSKSLSELDKYRLNYLKVLSTLAFVCMPLSAALTLMGKDVILLLLGPQWNSAGEIFIAFGPSIGVGMLYSTHAWLHLSLGTPDRWFRWGIVAFVTTTLCLIIGLPFGLLGIAIGCSLSYFILLVPGIYYAGRPINLKILSIISAILKYFMAAMIAGLLCWFLLYSYGVTSFMFLNLDIIYRIPTSFGLCMSIYFVLIVTVFRSRQSISEFIYLLREII